jgi:predicted ATPase
MSKSSGNGAHSSKTWRMIQANSPIIMAYPNAQILLIDEEGIQPVEYTETEHYRVTKDFLNRYERFLKELLA